MDKKKKMTTGQKILTAVCILLAIVLILSAGATIWIHTLLGKIHRIERPVDVTPPTETNEQGEVVTLPPTEPTEPVNVLEENILNILLVGQDRRAGEGNQRSDAMILCTLNKEKKTLTMTSFMRDLYVEIPGYYSNRLNVAYAVGGGTLLEKTILHNFDVKVDHFVEVDLFAFIDIIDVLGGVDIELTAAEASYLNKVGDPDFGKQTGWSLHPGVNHLNGSQASAYCRIRALDSDFGRTERQRKVMTKIFEDVKAMGVVKAYSILETILPLVTTNMSDADILSYAYTLLPMMGSIRVVNQRIPVDGAWRSQYIRGMAVLVPNLEKNKEFLNETIK